MHNRTQLITSPVAGTSQQVHFHLQQNSEGGKKKQQRDKKKKKKALLRRLEGAWLVEYFFLVFLFSTADVTSDLGMRTPNMDRELYDSVKLKRINGILLVDERVTETIFASKWCGRSAAKFQRHRLRRVEFIVMESLNLL